VGKTEGKNNLGDLDIDVIIVFQWIVKKLGGREGGREVMDWIDLARDRDM
jgi:hypothetical protein